MCSGTRKLIIVDVELHHVGHPGQPVQVLQLVVVQPQDLQLPALFEPRYDRDLVVAQVELAQAAHGAQPLDHLDLVEGEREHLELAHHAEAFNFSDTILRGVKMLQHNLPLQVLKALQLVAVKAQRAELLVVAQRQIADLGNAVHLQIKVLQGCQLVEFGDRGQLVAREPELAQLVQRVQPFHRPDAVVGKIQGAQHASLVQASDEQDVPSTEIRRQQALQIVVVSLLSKTLAQHFRCNVC